MTHVRMISLSDSQWMTHDASIFLAKRSRAAWRDTPSANPGTHGLIG